MACEDASPVNAIDARPFVGDDGVVAGVVSDVWVDRSECVARYFEVTLAGGRNVLLPMNFARVQERRVRVKSIQGHQFADVPGTAKPGVVTLLEEDRIQAMAALEQKQRQTKAFEDRHHKQIEKQFAIGKPVLVFQTKMGLMPGKLRFRWTRPYWIIDIKNGMYQVGTLAGEKVPKWINGFRLKPYQGEMPENPFRTEDH